MTPSLCNTCTDSLYRFLHFRARPRIAQTKESTSFQWIEINAGSDRHVGLGEKALGEFVAVTAKPRYIRIKIEGAIHGQNFLKAEFRQPREQIMPVFLVAALHRFHFRASIDPRQSRYL